jgi:hypothetical protein
VGVGIDTIIVDFSKVFDLVPHDGLFTKMAALGVNSRVVVCVREFLVGLTQKGKIRSETTQGSQSNLRCVTRERCGSTNVSSLRK